MLGGYGRKMYGIEFMRETLSRTMIIIIGYRTSEMNLTEYKKQVFDKITQLEGRIHMMEQSIKCMQSNHRIDLDDIYKYIKLLESDVNEFYGWFIDIKKKLEEQCKTTHSES
jgi:hypothetical protein